MNPYEIFGIEKTATQEEIKKKYRELSLRYHPDRNPEGEEMFKKINEANSIIGDPEKRKQYDTQGSNPFGSRNPFGGGFGRRPQYNHFEHEDLGDIFESFFNRTHTNTYGRRHGGFARGADIRLNIEVTVRESYLGSKKTFTYKRSTANGMVTETQTFEIPKGCDNGTMLKMAGAGSQANIDGGQPGDLILIIVLINDQFSKEDQDLHYTVNFDPIDLLIGKDLKIPHYDGEMKVTIPPYVNPMSLVRVKGKGFEGGPFSKERGDLYIRMNIVNTTLVPDELKTILKTFKETKKEPT